MANKGRYICPDTACQFFCEVRIIASHTKLNPFLKVLENNDFMENTYFLLQANEILKIHVRNKHKELWGAPIKRQMMSVMLNKYEANRRVGVDNEIAQGVNETDVNETKIKKQKTRLDLRKAGEMQIKVDAIKSESRLAELSKEDIALEVVQTAPGGNSSQLENLANEAKNSSDGEICTKNKTLETSDQSRTDPITSEVSDDSIRKKKKRDEQGGEEEDKTRMGKKIKTEVEEKNIKDEAVQRLKILQKGVKRRKLFDLCGKFLGFAQNEFLSPNPYLQGNLMGHLCSAAASSAQNGDFCQNLKTLHW